MADPVRYSIGYSFSSFQANSPSTPLPGPKLDIELAGISASTESLRSSVSDIRRSDGTLNNSIVTFNSLAPEVLYLFDSGSTTNATLLAAAVAGTTANAAAAQAANVAAQAAAAIATAGVDPAVLFAGAVGPEVAVNAATTTDIGNAASARVVVNGSATITSFGIVVKRLRLVRFNGASTLTHSASLILMTGRTRAVVAGDWGLYLSDAAGNWREITFTRPNSTYYVEHFTSVIGDGVTDDRAALQNIINMASTAGGGRVVLAPGVTYRCVINTGVTDFGFILKPNVILEMTGATIALECTGAVYGVRPMNNTTIQGGTIAVTVSAGLTNGFGGDQAIYHAPISLGAAGGDMGTVAAPKAYNQSHNWKIIGVTITSVRNNGQGSLIEGNGGVYDGVIRECVFPDNSTIAICIGFDWSPVGSISGANLAAAQTAYNAGTDYSIHPHDIVIERNVIGKMTMPVYTTPSPFGSHGVRLSGCYNVKVRDNFIDAVTYAAVYITGGDMSFDFAPAAVRLFAGKNMEVSGNIINECGNYFGIVHESYPDNLYDAAHNASNPQYPYNPYFYVDGYFINTVIRGNKLNSSAGSLNTQAGIYLFFLKGCVVEDNVIQGFLNGIKVAIKADNVQLLRNDISLCYDAGILIGDSSGPPEKTTVRENMVRRNCFNGASSGNIRIDYCQDAVVDNNLVGNYDEDKSLVGIAVTGGAKYATVTNNHVALTKTGGTAYVIAPSDPTVIWVFRDNRYGGTDAYTSGASIVPYSREYNQGVPGELITHARAQAAALTGGLTPTYGAWAKGSTIVVTDQGVSTAAAVVKCTVSGSPGTWKTISTVA